MASTAGLVAAPVLLCIFVLTIRVLWLRETVHGLPPGPKRLPLLGNIHQLSAAYQNLTFMQWGAQYGDIIYAKLFRQPIVILNSTRAAFDLLEKRGVKYSGRPHFTFFVDLVQWRATPFRDYDDSLRRHRRWYQSLVVSRAALDCCEPVQRREVQKLLLDLVQEPAAFLFHLKRFAAALMLEIGYGYTITSPDDEFIRVVEKGVSQALEGSSAGGALVDLLPFLIHLPEWMPGAGFKRTAAVGRASVKAMEDVPYERVKAEMADGIAKPSFTAAMIEECMRKGALTAEEESEIKSVSGALYASSTDTTLGAMVTFFLAMVLNPGIAKKAQEEIDQVVGEARLPDFGDRGSLPYVECIVQEVYRYCPTAPLAVPHRAAEDDVYRGYRIPRGSTVIANIWAMSRDLEVYPEPETFRPERFLGTAIRGEENPNDPRRFVFGFGRRACPGRVLADEIVWLVVVSVLATMDIRKARNAHGEEVEVTPVFVSGVVSHPAPFVCDIRPRSRRARQLVQASNIKQA